MASRVFATLLLAWTLSDLCGHALGLHDHGAIAPAPLASQGRAMSDGGPRAGRAGAGRGDSLDDCFYCGHCAELPLPFSVQARPGPVSAVIDGSQALPEATLAPLHRPPLA